LGEITQLDMRLLACILDNCKSFERRSSLARLFARLPPDCFP